MRVRRSIRAEHAGESVAAADFCADDLAVRTERFAQCRDLNLEVLFRHHYACPHPSEEVLLWDKQAVGVQEDHKEIEGARAELDRNTIGEQLPLPQQHAETAEFELRIACWRARSVRVGRQWVFTVEGRLRISICVLCSPSPRVVVPCNSARPRA